MLLVTGIGWHVGTLVEAGDIAAADQAVALFMSELPLRWRPHLGGDCGAMVALHRGRFDEAERMIREQMQQARRYGYPQAFDAASVQMFGLRREQGRLAELAPALDLFRRHAPAGGTWLPGYALLCCELARDDDARTAFEQIVADGLQPDHKADYMHRNLAYLCMVCARLGDAARAERLYALLAPFAGRNYVFGGNVECFGATDRLLGMLAATMQRWDLAEPHFERALQIDAASAALPWLAHTRHQYAAMLLARRHDGDATRAAALLDAALQGSRELGMRALELRVLALSGLAEPALSTDATDATDAAGAAAAAGAALGLSPRELQVLRLVAEGKTNQEIADTLFRSANTVANHVRNILAKIGCANRTEAAAFAARHGLLDPP
jgi:DNA-binding CsgD family transcriptional regulator